MGRSVCMLVLPSLCFSSLEELKAISAALVHCLKAGPFSLPRAHEGQASLRLSSVLRRALCVTLL